MAGTRRMMGFRSVTITFLSAAMFCSQTVAFQSTVATPMITTARQTSELYSSMMDAPRNTASSPEMKKKDLRTFQRFLEVECWKNGDIRDLDRTLLAVADACKQINRIVQRAQTDDLYGAAIDPLTGELAEENVQGEVQQQLDVLCNTIMLRAFCGASNNVVCAVASEEEPLPRSCADVMGYDTSEFNIMQSGDYVAVFDPIDGSKNIDSSLPVGTVFGIYRAPDGASAGKDGLNLDSFLQRGTKMVAAGYCLYSATTVLVLTLGSGVHGFTLDPDKQKFLQTHPNIRIPDVGSLYSFNEANYREFSEPVQQFLTSMKQSGVVGGKKVSSRYVGALVADVHNVLINGGIYGYPATRDNVNGKLRLLYESAPMAMIMEQAGGAGSTGQGRILDVLPPQRKKNNGHNKGDDEPDDDEAGKGIHVRVPTYLGSVENVYELEQCFKFYGEDD
ncbi:fructose-1,6-bisphosphatase [Skeletonema marinoi]|uniref:Fructose-1,6-bisphosphatase, cytosolic n=1 Tax=Skeletonema marinoi TaxID=267567 RepID=A0AAD8YLR1_9STRA|nr:fructose-1,6-bisphosphatase [Skeletonema marinoi]